MRTAGRRPRLLRAVALAVALAVPGAAPARADPPIVAMRAGSHPDYGRLVFDWPGPVGYRVQQEGDRVSVQFDAPAQFRLAGARVRNVLSVAERGGTIVIGTRPGARVNHFRIGNRVVLDVRDPGPQAGLAAAAPPPAPAPPLREARALPEAAPPAAAPPGVTPPAAAPPRAEPPPPAPPPPAPLAAPSPSPAAPQIAPPAEPSPPSAAAQAPTPPPREPAASAAPPPLAAAPPQLAAAPPVAEPPPSRPAPVPPDAPAARTPPGETVSRQAIEAMTDAERDGLGFFTVMAALSPRTGTGVDTLRYLVERNLRQLGYGSGGEMRLMPERVFRDAVRAYQRQIGAEPTGTLTFAQGERLLRVRNLLSETRVTAGPMLFIGSDSHVIASGTWTIAGGRPDHPVNRSQIACIRSQARCIEAASRLELRDAEASGTLVSELLTYSVVSWTAAEVRAEIDLRCTTRVLVIHAWSSEVSLLDRPLPAAECRDDGRLSPGIRVLRNGAEPIARFYDERQAAAASDVSPELRAFLNRAVAGPSEPAAVASWR